jgi:hypothetical protein
MCLSNRLLLVLRLIVIRSHNDIGSSIRSEAGWFATFPFSEMAESSYCPVTSARLLVGNRTRVLDRFASGESEVFGLSRQLEIDDGKTCRLDDSAFALSVYELIHP